MEKEQIELQFFCPGCAGILEMDGFTERCPDCGQILIVNGNVYDFVSTTAKRDEKGFYDGEYQKLDAVVGNKKSLDELASQWNQPAAPQDPLVRKVLGNVHGKTVLMIGNGASQKELALLQGGPHRLVYSDLSPIASNRIQAQVDYTGHEQAMRFAAIDAEHLPFVNNSVDIVYAYAMVHHLPNLEQFFKEVYRVLKPGGKTVFFDDAYSPIWHHSKQTWLKPLMKYSHRTTGISPEDYRFSMTGGFREDKLTIAIEAVGGTPYFERTAFLGYLIGRGAEKLLPIGLRSKIQGGWLHRTALKFDNMMSNFEFYRRNQIRLVWGFEK